jgi:hypothetical protein
MWQHHVFVCAFFLVQRGKCTGYSHITYHNEIFIILNGDFIQEIYVLPDDDKQCAIETCRNNENVLMCLILTNICYTFSVFVGV